MANRLAMDKSLAIHNLRSAGYSERRIARTLGISRGAVRRHLAADISNRTTAQTGQEAEAQSQLGDPNRTGAQTGANDQHEEENRVRPASPSDQVSQGGGSHCEPFREIIGEKLQIGLSAKRIHQDLVAEHGFAGKYWSVYRFVSSLQSTGELPFRRIEVAPGEELQVDFGSGAKIRKPNGTFRRT